jgi:hypothetical protein
MAGGLRMSLRERLRVMQRRGGCENVCILDLYNIDELYIYCGVWPTKCRQGSLLNQPNVHFSKNEQLDLFFSDT